jgi:hypothetical protein
LRLQARNLSEAMLWIEEDQEWIRYNASQLLYNSAHCNSTDPENSFGKDLMDEVSIADQKIGLVREEESSDTASVTTFYRKDLAVPLKDDNEDRQFAMKRYITVEDLEPDLDSEDFSMIRVNYRVYDLEADEDKPSIVGKNYEKPNSEEKEIIVEVVPDAVFKCPPK